MHLYSALAVVLVAVKSSLAGFSDQVTNFDLGPVFAFRHGCNITCQLLLEVTNRLDLEFVGKFFDEGFYATAPEFTSSSPGDILKIESFDASNLEIPTSIKTYRFQYTSIDVNGSLAPSTGFLALPAPNSYDTRSKLKLIAWAHGTTGLHCGCVPSSARKLWGYDSWGPLSDQGYAVVGTDYVGLGNNYTSHKYLSLAAHANDIYYSVMAVRKAFPDLFTVKWLSIGHSQGGGTVAIAPAVNALDLATTPYDKILPLPISDDYFAKAETPLLLMGIQAAFPSYGMPWAARALKERIQYASAAQSCLFATAGLTLDLTDEQLVVAGGAHPKDDDTLKEWTRQQAAAQGALSSMPILVIQGLSDTAILPECTRRAYENATRFSRIRLQEYPGVGHFEIVSASTPAWLEFVRDRFSGYPTSFESSRHVVDLDDPTLAGTSIDMSGISAQRMPCARDCYLRNFFGKMRSDTACVGEWCSPA
ncbi:unnamed protein product [Aureobasidium uvarum]|uniref:Alpha/beta-hydrolase n=1 Tax=Aureobasidium uvarum TaxID=2773716 RepID=A0A9N8PTT6_9PEZI|nr:unnamed protein product [Aureobasidium uvarum]